MKKLFILIVLLTGATCLSKAQATFHRQTKHKPVKVLKRHEVKKIQSGHNLYSRDSRGVYKTSRMFSGITRPKDAARNNLKRK